MSRFASLAACLVVASACLAGCGGSSSSEEDEPQEASDGLTYEERKARRRAAMRPDTPSKDYSEEDDTEDAGADGEGTERDTEPDKDPDKDLDKGTPADDSAGAGTEDGTGTGELEAPAEARAALAKALEADGDDAVAGALELVRALPEGEQLPTILALIGDGTRAERRRRAVVLLDRWLPDGEAAPAAALDSLLAVLAEHQATPGAARAVAALLTAHPPGTAAFSEKLELRTRQAADDQLRADLMVSMMAQGIGAQVPLVRLMHQPLRTADRKGATYERIVREHIDAAEALQEGMAERMGAELLRQRFHGAPQDELDRWALRTLARIEGDIDLAPVVQYVERASTAGLRASREEVQGLAPRLAAAKGLKEAVVRIITRTTQRDGAPVARFWRDAGGDPKELVVELQPHLVPEAMNDMMIKRAQGVYRALTQLGRPGYEAMAEGFEQCGERYDETRARAIYGNIANREIAELGREDVSQLTRYVKKLPSIHLGLLGNREKVSGVRKVQRELLGRLRRKLKGQKVDSISHYATRWLARGCSDDYSVGLVLAELGDMSMAYLDFSVVRRLERKGTTEGWKVSGALVASAWLGLGSDDPKEAEAARAYLAENAAQMEPASIKRRLARAGQLRVHLFALYRPTPLDRVLQLVLRPEVFDGLPQDLQALATKQAHVLQRGSMKVPRGPLIRSLFLLPATVDDATVAEIVAGYLRLRAGFEPWEPLSIKELRQQRERIAALTDLIAIGFRWRPREAIDLWQAAGLREPLLAAAAHEDPKVAQYARRALGRVPR